jgi:hypothetical protein
MYTVIFSDYLKQFEAHVAEALGDGWQLAGGVCVTLRPGNGSVTYYQALTKAAEETSPLFTAPKSPSIDATPSARALAEEHSTAGGADELLAAVRLTTDAERITVTDVRNYIKTEARHAD